MNIKEIKLDRIDIPEFYFRMDDPITLKKIENSIRANGLLRPIVVKEVGDRYECVEGRQILKVVHRMQQTAIFCVVLDPKSKIDSPSMNLLLNITHPQESLAKIAYFMKEKCAEVGEANLSSFFPYSTDEIKRFVEICTFDWSQFLKKQSAVASMFDLEEIEQTESQPEVEKEPIPEPVEEPKISYVKLSEEEKEQNNTHESEDKILVRSEDVTSSLMKELIKDKRSKAKSENKPKLEGPKPETQSLF